MSSSLWLVLTVFIGFSTLAMSYQSNSNNPDLLDAGKIVGQIQHQYKRPFYVGSRYGRSQSFSSKDTGPVVVSRNDRFFLGSRYGKRSQELYPDMGEQDFTNNNNNNNINNNQGQQNQHLSCVFTGTDNLYRCIGNEKSSNFYNHVSVDDSRK